LEKFEARARTKGSHEAFDSSTAALSRGNFSSQPVCMTTVTQVIASIRKPRVSEASIAGSIAAVMLDTNCPGEYTTASSVNMSPWPECPRACAMRCAQSEVRASREGNVCMASTTPRPSNSRHRGSNSGSVG
jgi:hypothetical protein